MNNNDIADAMTIKLPAELPPKKEFVKGIRRAPSRGFNLSKSETIIALKKKRDNHCAEECSAVHPQ